VALQHAHNGEAHGWRSQPLSVPDSRTNGRGRMRWPSTDYGRLKQGRV
jgi:hypothetical protein